VNTLIIKYNILKTDLSIVLQRERERERAKFKLLKNNIQKNILQSFTNLKLLNNPILKNKTQNK
jgi:hypothetical protein